MWELDHIEGWVVKNWCLRIVVLEKTLESPWDSKDIKPVNPKGSQPWIFTGRTVLKLKLLCFSHLMWRANSLEKTMMLGKTEAGGEGGFREWDGWMASLTQQTHIWTNPRRRWRTGKPGVLQSQRIGHEVAQSCPTLCDPIDCSAPSFPVLHYLLQIAQTHVHWVDDAIQPSHPLLPASPVLNLSQHQGPF